MLTARKLGLGLLFLIIGYLIGRYYLPAIPTNTLSLAGLRGKPVPAATPIPVAPPPQTAAPPQAVAPPAAAGTSAFPTPYPTPGDSGVATTAASAPASPVGSRPSLYPTPYPTPSEISLLSTPTPAPIAVNRAPAPATATATAPAAITLDSLLDRQSHFPYVILGLIALAVLYKKRSDERIICVTMLILGIILGHYVDPGPINFTNPFTRAG